MYVFAISPAGGYGDDVADAEGGVGVVDEDVGAAVEMLEGEGMLALLMGILSKFRRRRMVGDLTWVLKW